MVPKPVVVGVLAAGCLAAAGVGGYVAVRQNAADEVAAATLPAPAASEAGEAASPPVSESEVEITPPAAEPAGAPDQVEEERSAVPAPPPVERERAPARPRRSETASSRTARVDASRSTPSPSRGVPAEAARPEPPVERGSVPAIPEPVSDPLPAAARPEPVVYDPPPPPAPEFVQVVVPASSVIGLRIETSLDSERAEVEDRVDARVTRDVTVDGRVAIPAGSRVVGAVTLVERGGKIKERARLGVRFHTLVFADGLQVPIRTDAIYRDGESPANSSSKKIGGAAVGGAILGAILGGGKGAAIGGAAGAAGGTAAAMAGDRRPATLPAGTLLTIRLSEPVSLEVEKH